MSLKHTVHIIVLAVFLWALSCDRDFMRVENAIFLLPEFFWGDAVKSAPSHVTEHHLQRIISNTKLSFYLELSCLRSLACDTGEGKELHLVADSSSRTEYIFSFIPSSVLNLITAAASSSWANRSPQLILSPGQPPPVLSCAHLIATRLSVQNYVLSQCGHH